VDDASAPGTISVRRKEKEDAMKRSTKWFLGAAIAVGTFGAGTGAVLASGGADEAEDGAETPITGTELDQASAAALDHLGEGRVSDTEVGDEEGYYEVEVTLDDGSEVDVHLDAEFTVLGTEAEGADEESGTDD
jgi:uncharacterized membrane protein YkoI